MYFTVQENETVCGNCQHYTQHYIHGGGYVPCNAGHCKYPRIKDRKPGQPGCKNFNFREKEV